MDGIHAVAIVSFFRGVSQLGPPSHQSQRLGVWLHTAWLKIPRVTVLCLVTGAVQVVHVYARSTSTLRQAL